MTNIGPTLVQPRLFPMALTIIAMVVLIGCGRSEEDTELQESPSFPDTTNTDNTFDSDLVTDNVEVVQESLPECAQMWDAQHLFQMLTSAYHYGGYQPFQPYGHYSDEYMSQRGFKRSSRGRQFQAMSCANDLMGAASFLQTQAQYYGPGAIQTWLGGMVGWAYGGGGEFGVGYAGNQWGGYDPLAWGNSPWVQ